MGEKKGEIAVTCEPRRKASLASSRTSRTWSGLGLEFGLGLAFGLRLGLGLGLG